MNGNGLSIMPKNALNLFPSNLELKTAHRIWLKAASLCGPCTCYAGYKDRQLIDPECLHCNLGAEFRGNAEELEKELNV